ncbi:hypothetical protein RJ639_001848 [Escallonia herrerae]|uniref:PGG domain-containing protein n=1 Tax=Escallonia herrerae TaxID=1293975 RepID=A0AA89BID4_9ASTE|nr:hypothetical protein RJ639_001848 [Escallonia herrerae]
MQLAKFLIEKDTSWESTESALGPGPKTHIYSAVSAVPEGRGGPKLLNLEKAKTPLLLAAKYGCAEIVEEILRMYPQAVEHVDDEGRNILHVAIQYRQKQIFHVVEKMKFPMKRLTRKIDNKGNSILHMVGIDKEDQKATDMRNPGLQLQENLLLFERLKKASKTEFIMHLNSEGITAEKLFAVSNAELRRDAKDWIKLTAEHCSIVAVFIATVAFAAAYTVPGGPNQTTGYPILLHQPFFITFAITDVLSLTFALTSVIAFLSILTSPFWLEDFKHNLPRTLMIGFTLLIASVLMMMLAFAATIFLMIHNKQQWAKISLSSLALLPATFFVFLYLRFYVSLMEPFKHSVKMLGSALPQSNSAGPLCSWITNLVSRRHKLHSNVPANRA